LFGNVYWTIAFGGTDRAMTCAYRTLVPIFAGRGTLRDFFLDTRRQLSALLSIACQNRNSSTHEWL